jgi:CubicO group peptidase (beta-lactamase class C family)
MKKIVRQLIIGSLVGVIFPIQLLATDDWQTISIEEAGFSWDVGERLDSAFENGELKNLHSVIVVRNRRVVIERYYEGFDKNWGNSIGNVVFTPDTLHDLQSITKSIVSLLYGIALAEGRVPKLNAPLVDSFPDYNDLINDPDRRRIKVKHALSMTMGLEWNEKAPYGSARNSETAMWRSSDRYRYALSQSIVAEPGTTFNYSGGSTTLLGRIISTGVGKSLPDYAKEKLFHPMAITEFEWTRVRGDEDAAGGLRMRPRDLAKIGQLVLNQGRWKDVQLVPSSWLTSSFLESASVSNIVKYGYQWWIVRLKKLNDQWVFGEDGLDKSIAGVGWGDQRLIIVPTYQLVIVINAGNYGVRNSKLTKEIYLNYIMPALRY